MAITSYKLLKGTTQSQLAQAVQLEMGLGGRTLVFNGWSKGGYLCQGVGVGTLDEGTVSAYFMVTSAIDDTFAALINNALPYYQPLGTPVIFNNALYQAMGIVTPGTGQGIPGKSPQLRIGAGYIQWKYDSDIVWNDLIALDALKGTSIQLRATDEYIQCKYTTDPYWENLVSLDSLRGPANVMTVGTVTTLPAGNPASVEITGQSPAQTLNFGIPRGEDAPANSLSIGTVTTGPEGSNAEATVTGTPPTQTLNLTIPRGNAGTNSVVELLTGTVVTAGTAVSLIFTKTYSSAPIVVPIPQWSNQQLITGVAVTVTTTGCAFLAMQSRGTLLLTSGPFENAAAGKTFQVMVIGN